MKKQYRVLQLDGGGIKGVMFLVFLVSLEKQMNRKISDIFDMFIGTSTGGISAGLFAMGMSAKEVLKFYEDNASKIFDKKWFWMTRKTRYKRKQVDDLCNKLMWKKMKHLAKRKKIFICTGVQMQHKIDGHYVDGDERTHFFKC